MEINESGIEIKKLRQMLMTIQNMILIFENVEDQNKIYTVNNSQEILKELVCLEFFDEAVDYINLIDVDASKILTYFICQFNKTESKIFLNINILFLKKK